MAQLQTGWFGEHFRVFHNATRAFKMIREHSSFWTRTKLPRREQRSGQLLLACLLTHSLEPRRSGTRSGSSNWRTLQVQLLPLMQLIIFPFISEATTPFSPHIRHERSARLQAHALRARVRACARMCVRVRASPTLNCGAPSTKQ